MSFLVVLYYWKLKVKQCFKKVDKVTNQKYVFFGLKYQLFDVKAKNRIDNKVSIR